MSRTVFYALSWPALFVLAGSATTPRFAPEPGEEAAFNRHAYEGRRDAVHLPGPHPLWLIGDRYWESTGIAWNRGGTAA